MKLFILKNIYFTFILYSLINLVFIKEVSDNLNFISEDKSDEVIDLIGVYEREIILNSENNKTYIFNIMKSLILYFFVSDDKTGGYIHYDKDIQCPNLCAVQYNDEPESNNKVYINYYKNATEQNITIKISSIAFNGKIQSIKSNDFIKDAIYPIETLNSYLIFESYTEYIAYFKTIDESASVRCSEYNNEMTILDIININDNYFNNLL